MKYAATIKKVKSPISGRERGWEVIVAVMNQARYNALHDCYEQSFAPKYEIASFPIVDPSRAEALLAARHPTLAQAEIVWM